MKAFAIPSMSTALSAVLSLSFYGVFSYFYGDTLLAWVIMLTSLMSLVQLALVPQAWLYVVGSTGNEDMFKRFSVGTLAELVGGAAGVFVVALLFFLPLETLHDHQADALLAFGGLWIAGSTSVQGLLRAQRDWVRFAAWILIPNCVRIVLVIALPYAAQAGWMPRLEHHSVVLVAAYFLLPEVIRFLIVNLPCLLSSFSFPSTTAFIDGLRSIFKNWLFDFGSAITESGDKLLVGTFVGTQLLATYFFARKIGAAATIAIEAFYAEHYRRIVLGPPEERGRRQTAAYLGGFLIGFPIAIAAAGTVLIGTRIPAIAHYVPEAIRENYLAFATLLLIDSGIAANRWSRYVSQSGSWSVFLLVCRLVSFSAFAVALAGSKSLPSGVSLCLSFLLVWLFDLGVVNVMFRAERHSIMTEQRA